MTEENMTQHVYVKGDPLHMPNSQDAMIVAEAATRLGQWYPGHIWRVKVNSDRLGGIVMVEHADISHTSNQTYAYVVPLSEVYEDPNYLWAMRAGGELLERAGISRGSAKEGDVIRHVEGIPEKHQPIRGILI